MLACIVPGSQQSNATYITDLALVSFGYDLFTALMSLDILGLLRETNQMASNKGNRGLLYIGTSTKHAGKPLHIFHSGLKLGRLLINNKAKACLVANLDTIELG